MRISKWAFVKQYKKQKKCNTQIALLKWKKILLHFGIDPTYEKLRFGMNNNNNVAAVNNDYIGYNIGDDVIVVNSLGISVGEIIKNGNVYETKNYIRNIPINHASVEDALKIFGNNIQCTPLQYTDQHGQIQTLNNRLKDADSILNIDYFKHCKAKRFGNCTDYVYYDLANLIMQDCSAELRNYMNVIYVEKRNDPDVNKKNFYINFHDRMNSAAIASRKYHLSFHTPPTRLNCPSFCYHFAIDQQNYCNYSNLLFDVISQKFIFVDVPNIQNPFPVNNNVQDVKKCILKNLNNFINSSNKIFIAGQEILPIIQNGLVIKKISDSQAPMYIRDDTIISLETRINNRIDGNNPVQFVLQNHYKDKNYLMNAIITRQDIEEIFFVKGLNQVEYSNRFKRDVYPPINVHV